MRSEASSDVFKVWLYAAAAVMLGAWTSPRLYDAGKALAEICATKQTNGPLSWLAGICQSTDFPGFFVAATVIFAGLLFLPFMHWLHGGRAAAGSNPWSFRLPAGARPLAGGQRLVKNPHGLRQGTTGFLLVTAFFLAVVGALVLAGVLHWKNPGAALVKIAAQALASALGLAVLQEILFRGIAMGIFLRAMRPAAALGLSAVLFALVHFLNPPPGMNVLDPDAAGVGFELLRKIALQFSDPRVVLGTFTPLLALGGMLAYARWRTASLCLPVGIHAGWIFTHSMLGSMITVASHPSPVMRMISGASLKQGLIPLAAILLAAAWINHLTRPSDDTDAPA